LVEAVLIPLLLLILIVTAVVSRCVSRSVKKRLVWGEAPIINNVYWAKAMEEAGFFSETFTDNYCWSLNKREQYDLVLQEMFGKIPLKLKYYAGFLYSLFRYDIFFISFNGFFLRKTMFCGLEPFLFKVARKKVVIIPFGADAYDYGKVRSTTLLHGLNNSLPSASRLQGKISKRVDLWNRNADLVIPGMMGFDGIGRWDALTPSILTINTKSWTVSQRDNLSDGSKTVVNITHSPNFRGFKGSEFIIDAVAQLQKEGLLVELKLLEGVQNEIVKKVLLEESDIHLEQLIFTGYAVSGIEGMATGLPVVSNLEDENYTRPFRRWSFLDECPIVSSTPERIVDDLRKLVTRPSLRKELGIANRQYVDKYHSYQASQFLFNQVIEYLEGKRESLMSIYHPLDSEYLRDQPKISIPLSENHIID
jgi:hypothetical protein